MITLWVGAAIGAAMKIGGHIAGGIAAKNEAAKSQAELDKQREKNQQWYARNYNEDGTQRADAQRMLTKTEEMIRNRNQAAQGAQAVMGGTSESIAASKAANNRAISDTASGIAASSAARKDAVDAAYMQSERGLSEQQRQIYDNRAQQIKGAVQGVADAGSSMVSTKFNVNKDPEITNLTEGSDYGDKR